MFSTVLLPHLLYKILLQINFYTQIYVFACKINFSFKTCQKIRLFLSKHTVQLITSSGTRRTERRAKKEKGLKVFSEFKAKMLRYPQFLLSLQNKSASVNLKAKIFIDLPESQKKSLLNLDVNFL